jgi:hypothetical protein
MIQTVEAIIDENGIVRLLQEVQLGSARRALVTILDVEPVTDASETAQLSEEALSEWNSAEEDAAWAHLQQDR